MTAPLRWLARGWADFKATPNLSLFYGTVIFFVSIIVSAVAWQLGSFGLLAVLLTGFVYIAPLIAVGLYSVSRAREAGRQPTLSESFVITKKVLGQAGVFALVQLVILLVWSRAGLIVHAFVELDTNKPAALLEFLLLGSAIGSIFAAITFAASAFSLPLIAHRDVDMITACISSINAVLKNKLVMLVWGVLICGLTALGFATAFLGLIVVMPWLAYATWHAYQDTLDASTWPKLSRHAEENGSAEPKG